MSVHFEIAEDVQKAEVAATQWRLDNLPSLGYGDMIYNTEYRTEWLDGEHAVCFFYYEVLNSYYVPSSQGEGL